MTHRSPPPSAPGRTSRSDRGGRPTLVGYSRSHRACDRCGKSSGLHGTVVLRLPGGELARLGSDCAASALGLRDAAGLVDRAMRAQARLDALAGARTPDSAAAEAADYLRSRDPSGRGKYLTWALYVWHSGQALKEEIAEVVELFHRYGGQLPKRDINQYHHSELASLSEALRAIRDRAESRKKKVESRHRVEEAPDYDVVYDSPSVTAYLIKNKAASMQIGAGTRWCVTQKSAAHYENYDSLNVVLVYLLSKRLGEGDARYKIAISYPRDSDCRVVHQKGRYGVKVQYWLADDKQISEEAVEDLYGAEWSAMREAILPHVEARPMGLLARVRSGKGTAEDARAAYEMTAQLDEQEQSAVREIIIQSETCPEDVLLRAMDDPHAYVRHQAAGHRCASARVFERAMEDDSDEVRRIAAGNPLASAQVIARGAKDKKWHVREAAVRNPSAPESVIERAMEDENAAVRCAAVRNPSAPASVMERAMGDSDITVVCAAAKNSSAPAWVIKRAMGDIRWHVRRAAAANRAAPAEVLTLAMEDIYEDTRVEAAANRAAPQEVLVLAMRDPKLRVRGAAARNPSAPAAVLEAAIGDPVIHVRLTAAENPSAPASVLSRAMDDESEDVRAAAARNRTAPESVIARALADRVAYVRHSAAKNPSAPASMLAVAMEEDADKDVRAAARLNIQGRIDV